MIRAILVVGWLGMALLAVAAFTGYTAHDPESAQQHMILALFPSGALLFADLCLLVYMPGTARVARRTAAEAGLGEEWAREQARLARRGASLATIAAIATGTLFGTGFPLYAGAIQPWIHHVLFALVVILQLLFLLLGGRSLQRGERHLAALGEAVAARGLP